MPIDRQPLDPMCPISASPARAAAISASRPFPTARVNGRGRGGPVRLLAVAGCALLLLAGCGGAQTPAPAESGTSGQTTTATTPPEATTQAIVLASPQASPGPGRLPAATPAAPNQGIQVETFEATIADGALTPNEIEGLPGASYVLRITGDGAEHEIAIEGLTNPERVAADGVTDLQFTVSEEPGDFRILIDGTQAGVFTATSPSGMPGTIGDP